MHRRNADRRLGDERRSIATHGVGARAPALHTPGGPAQHPKRPRAVGLASEAGPGVCRADRRNRPVALRNQGRPAKDGGTM